MRRRWLLACLLLPGAALAVVALRREPRPNVVLISIDSLRADHLSCYGYPRPTSPNLDRLAREGALFLQCVSTTSWTLPAHAALFTGLPDSVHGATDVDRWLDGSRTTLAEQFRAAGYTTAGFFSGPFLHPAYGFGQGFEHYEDCTAYAEAIPKARSVGEVLRLMHGNAPKDVTGGRVLAAVRRWLARRPAKPFFLFIHLWDVHYDYIPPSPFREKFLHPYQGPLDGRNVHRIPIPPGGLPPADRQRLIDLYDGEIAWTDHIVGRIRAALEEAGILDRTVFAVTADHGEEFLEHGGLTHRNSLYEEVLRVPLILRYPPRIRPGTRIRGQVTLYDVAPTLLDLAGAPPLPVTAGQSLLPCLQDAFRPTPTRLAVAELWAANSERYFFALRTDRWKLIIDWVHRRHEVYDLIRDPGERHPLPDEDYPLPPAALRRLYREMRTRLERWRSALPPIGARDTPVLPALKKEELRRLGYLK